MTTAAFFDLDNTLMKGSSMYHLGKGLVRHGELRAADLRRFAMDQSLFRVKGSEPPLERLQAAALTALAGRSATRLEALADKIVEEIVPRYLYLGAMDLLRDAQASHDETWILTAAPQPLAQRIAERLGCTGARGTELSVSNDEYSGVSGGGLHHGSSKAVTVDELSLQRGLDLAGCEAFSDSYHDLPLLMRVGLPAAVNPDRSLRRHARAAGWPVHDVSPRSGVLRAVKLGIALSLPLLALRSARHNEE